MSVRHLVGGKADDFLDGGAESDRLNGGEVIDTCLNATGKVACGL